MPKGSVKPSQSQTSGPVYPLGVKGDLIGTPGVGTHSFSAAPNNWESDNAVDIAIPVGTDVIAVEDGVIGSSIGPLSSSDPRMAGLRFHLETKTNEFYYAHLSTLNVKAGESVKKGQICGKSGSANGVAHLHFASENGDPQGIINGEIVPGTGGGSTPTGVTSGVDLQTVEAIAKAASFATYLELPGVLDSAESMALKGERSLMNDQPLMPFIEQLCQASLRRFQSMPNGNFFAFYPDYFGGMNHRTPYWHIDDIEILKGHIDLSDEALATHVYVVGDTVGMWDGINTEDRASSSGVVDIFRAMAADFITGLPISVKKAPNDKKALVTKDQTIAFLKKYGARPYYEEAPMVRSSFYELFLAYQKFCLLWSKQFLTEFEFTYMPELFPGGIIALPQHQIQMFIEEVEHQFDYESGFTTKAMLSSPAALKNGPNGVHEGMVRAHAINPTGN